MLLSFSWVTALPVLLTVGNLMVKQKTKVVIVIELHCKALGLFIID